MFLHFLKSTNHRMVIRAFIDIQHKPNYDH